MKHITERIQAFNAQQRKLLLLKIKELVDIKSKNTASSQKIVAFVQGKSTFSEDKLRADLKQKLPDYMVPSQIVMVKDMPLLPNGKINRRILKVLPNSTTSTTSNTTNTNVLENKLIEIWQNTLGFAPITKHDNFFEIGGDSILSIQIISKARKEGLKIAPNALFKHQTIAELSQFVETNTDNTIHIEEKLIGIWEETLGFSPIHIDDNFFEIGGDSILSIQIVSKAKKAGIILKANSLFEHQTIKQLSSSAIIENTDKKVTEHKLIKIWEETLGFAPITSHDNFFEIGGDSILSIQIISKARKQGIILESTHIFEHQTITELLPYVKTNNTTLTTNMLIGEVLLSPIQHWFFEEHRNAPHFWNQGVRLDNLPNLNQQKLQDVCNYIITKHDALRSVFKIKASNYIQEISSPHNIRTLEYVDITHLTSQEYQNFIQTYLVNLQQAFSLSEGALFKCIVFDTGKTKTTICYLIAHHLVVDAISWRIITDDFISAIKQVNFNKTLLLQSKTNSIKEWRTFIHLYAKENAITELPFWKQQIVEHSLLPFNIEDKDVIEEKDITHKHFTLSSVETSRLIEAKTAYNTKIDELLISAFVSAVGKWSTKSEVAIGFEKHGRETAGTTLNLSETVGWFTSYFPIKFNYAQQNSVKNNIIDIKEKMRSVPNGGIGFGILRYINGEFKNAKHPEIVFNFLGTTVNKTSDEDIIVTPLIKNLRDKRSERRYKLELNMHITNGALYGSLNYANNVFTEETINKLVEYFKACVFNIIEHCNTTETGGYTPSDFSETEISQDDLDNLLDALE